LTASMRPDGRLQDLFAWPLLHFILPHFCRNFAATFVICLLLLLLLLLQPLGAFGDCTCSLHTVHTRKLLGQNICAMPGMAYSRHCTAMHSLHTRQLFFVMLVKRPEIWFLGSSLAQAPMNILGI